MGELIQFHLVKDLDIERCKFLYGNGEEFDGKAKLNILRLLADCCTERQKPNVVVALDKKQINMFIEQKNYVIRVAHFADINSMIGKLAEIDTDLVLYIFLVGPNRPVNSFPIPADRDGLLSLKIIEDFDQDVQAVLLY